MGGRADRQPLGVGFAAGVRGWNGVGSFARWTFHEGWSGPRAGKSNIGALLPGNLKKAVLSQCRCYEAGRAAWRLG